MCQCRPVCFQVQLVQMFGSLISAYEPSNLLRRAPARSGHFPVPPALQGRFEAVDQGLSGERLGQETGRSGRQRPHARVIDGESRDENERHAVSLGKQAGLQVEAAHRRHLNIRDHTGAVIQVRRRQEFLGRRERMNDVAKRPDKIVGGGANGAVVVDDGNYGWAGQSRPSWSAAGMPLNARVRRKLEAENHT
jgi:hypothetical protein